MAQRRVEGWVLLVGGLLLALGAGACTGAGPAARVVSTDSPLPRFTDAGRAAAIEAALPAVDRVFREAAEAQQLPGFAWAVVVDGERVLTGAAGLADVEGGRPVTAHTGFHIASMTKSVVALAVLKLRDEGRLGLDDPVVRWVPGFAAAYPTADAATVTLRHLLTMSAGLPEDNPWADRHLADPPEALRAQVGQGVLLADQPGARYQYSNLGYALLGQVIERVSGQSYRAYIDAAILEPLGMRETYWDYADVPPDRLAMGYQRVDGRLVREPMLHSGALGAIGGLITTVDDYTRYVAFQLDAWPPRSAPETGPVKRSTVRETHRPGVSWLVAGAKTIDGEACPLMAGYGFGWVTIDDCKGHARLIHDGGLPGFGSFVQLYPRRGVALFSFANLRRASLMAPHARARDALTEAGALVRRTTPATAILHDRAGQVVQLVRDWDAALAEQVLADNVALDVPYDRRRAQIAAVLDEAGPIEQVEPVVPIDRLRGVVLLRGARRDVQVFFSLTPVDGGRVQALSVSLRPPRPEAAPPAGGDSPR